MATARVVLPPLDAGFFTELKVILFCSFFLGANFVVALMPLLGIGAFYGPAVVRYACRAYFALAAIDLVVPLKKRGMWMEFSRVTNITEGLRSYFKAELVVEGELRKDKNYLLCYYPHGLFGIGYSLMIRHLYEAYGSITYFTAADVIALIPLLRRVMTWWGYTSASRGPMMKNLQLQHPYNVLELHPDGIAGMFYGTRHEQIVLNKRKGFCKIALQTGAHLIPTYVFGANEVYTRYFEHTGMMAKLSSKIQMSLVPWTGRWGVPFSVVPHRSKIVAVIGAPIEVAKVADPSKEQVEALHAKFVAETKALYDRHKGRMGAEWAARRDKLYLEDEVTPSKKGAAAGAPGGTECRPLLR